MLQPWHGDTLSICDKIGESWATTFVSNGEWQDFNTRYSYKQGIYGELREGSF